MHFNTSSGKRQPLNHCSLVTPYGHAELGQYGMLSDDTKPLTDRCWFLVSQFLYHSPISERWPTLLILYNTFQITVLNHSHISLRTMTWWVKLLQKPANYVRVSMWSIKSCKQFHARASRGKYRPRPRESQKIHFPSQYSGGVYIYRDIAPQYQRCRLWVALALINWTEIMYPILQN